MIYLLQAVPPLEPLQARGGPAPGPLLPLPPGPVARPPVPGHTLEHGGQRHHPHPPLPGGGLFQQAQHAEEWLVMVRPDMTHLQILHLLLVLHLLHNGGAAEVAFLNLAG